MREMKPTKTPQTTSGLLMGPEQATRSLKPCKLYDDHKRNINFLPGRANLLFVEDPAASWSWGDNQPHEKESEVNTRHVVYITTSTI